MKTRTEYGQVNYAAYVAAVGGKTWDGRPCPTWDELTDKIRAGWETGALVVMRSVLESPVEERVQLLTQLRLAELRQAPPGEPKSWKEPADLRGLASYDNARTLRKTNDE